MKNNTKNTFVNIVDEIIETGRKRGIIQLYTDDQFYDGRTISLNGKQHLNFGSCSYLGLETDQRLKDAAIEAIQKYGIQYSSSRSYVSPTLYTELEELVHDLFKCYAVLTPTTTLGHQAVISTLFSADDLVIMDQQVHASVQYAAMHTKLTGSVVEIIRHNNMEELEKALIRNRTKHKRIWYMADGVYSMYGNFLPLNKLRELLDLYPELHLYIDDAHGMSWTGKQGLGHVLGEMEIHERMIVGTSFAKGFGTGGGVFLFKDERSAQKVRNCGGPLIFSGPNQIPVLAASIASAKIHLTEEIHILQKDLQSKIKYCRKLLQEHKLPLISSAETPIHFIGLGLTRVGYNMVQRMLNDGFYCNLAVFPAVPETCTGLRFTLTTHHSFEDVEKLVSALAFHFPKALKEEGRTVNDIQRAFRKVKDLSFLHSQEEKKEEKKLVVQHEKTIRNFSREQWNSLLTNGTFDYDYLIFLEETFSGNILEEHNWDFDYYMIYDDVTPVLVTFFTTTISKDDMLSSEITSQKVEAIRKENKYYLCSRTMMMGAPITEGEHFYLDRKNKNWKDAFMLLLDKVWSMQQKREINTICLRDFMAGDHELADFLMAQGFLRITLPVANMISNVTWNNEKEYLQTFNSRQRWYLKDNVLKYQDMVKTEIVSQPSHEQIKKWYELYTNVKSRGFELNTFDLPEKFFQKFLEAPNAEVIQISLKGTKSVSSVVAVSLNFRSSNNNYCGIVIGLDYDFLKSHSIYKQMLYTSVVRAGELHSKKIFLGFTASQVKSKFGAEQSEQVAFAQSLDNFNQSVIASISTEGSTENF